MYVNCTTCIVDRVQNILTTVKTNLIYPCYYCTILPLLFFQGNTTGKHLEHVMIELMDGCFGLVRKKSAGSNVIPSRHSGTFFFSDINEVDSFVDDYSKKAKEAPMVRH